MFRIGTAGAIACAAALAAGCGGGQADDPDRVREPSGDRSAGLYRSPRARALGAAKLDLPARAPGHPDVVGVVIDIPKAGRVATLVAMTDGATSLYTSVGGAMIGGGEHERVARANSRLLDEAQGLLAEFRPDTSTDLPPADAVRIFVVTPAGRRVRDVAEDDFWTKGAGPLPSIVAAAQGVMTELNRVE